MMENMKRKKWPLVAVLIGLAAAFYIGFFFLVINR